MSPNSGSQSKARRHHHTQALFFSLSLSLSLQWHSARRRAPSKHLAHLQSQHPIHPSLDQNLAVAGVAPIAHWVTLAGDGTPLPHPTFFFPARPSTPPMHNNPSFTAPSSSTSWTPSSLTGFPLPLRPSPPKPTTSSACSSTPGPAWTLLHAPNSWPDDRGQAARCSGWGCPPALITCHPTHTLDRSSEQTTPRSTQHKHKNRCRQGAVCPSGGQLVGNTTPTTRPNPLPSLSCSRCPTGPPFSDATPIV